MRSLARRALLAAALAVIGSAVFTAAAPANFHFMAITEAYSDGGVGNNDFVELQMYSSGQNFVGGHTIQIYDATGSTIGQPSFTFTGSVVNDANQATILVRKTGGAPGADGYWLTGDIPASGGAACFDNVDCVRWGNFSGSLPSPAGTNAGALDASHSLTRSKAPDCTLLQGSDDTNVSANDFFHAAPSPVSNGGSQVQKACPKLKIREVHPTTIDSSAFLELQFYAPGQASLEGHNVQLYAADGTLVPQPFAFDNTSLANTGSQRRVLLGDTGAAPHVPDFTALGLSQIAAIGGAVCLPDAEVPDCVTWGSFMEPAFFPDPQAAKAPAASVTDSLKRSIAGACPTALDLTDDSGNSMTDFGLDSTPDPENNSVMPPETLCSTLTIVLAGTGTGGVSGTFTPSGTPIGCPPTPCTYLVPSNQTANLVPAADPGSSFAGWTNCPMLTGDDCSAPMFEMGLPIDRTITATFNDPSLPPPGGSGSGTPPPTATQPTGQRAAALKRCAKIKNKKKKKKCKKRARSLPV